MTVGLRVPFEQWAGLHLLYESIISPVSTRQGMVVALKEHPLSTWCLYDGQPPSPPPPTTTTTMWYEYHNFVSLPRTRIYCYKLRIPSSKGNQVSYLHDFWCFSCITRLNKYHTSMICDASPTILGWPHQLSLITWCGPFLAYGKLNLHKLDDDECVRF